MQFEQQNPVATMVEQWQWRRPEVATLYAGGQKSLLKLRSMMQSVMVPERMRSLRSFEELDLDCFTDWQLAFEVILALTKLSVQSSPADEHLVNLLATNMYMHLHRQELTRKIMIGSGIAAILAVTPWFLHKLAGYTKKN